MVEAGREHIILLSIMKNKRNIENTVIWILFLLFSVSVTGFILWNIYQFRTGGTQIQKTLLMVGEKQSEMKS